MFKKVFVLFFLVAFALTLNGCLTAGKQKDLNIQGLKNQISVLEAQVQSKDQEISGLKDSLNAANEQAKAQIVEPAKEKSAISVKSHPKVKEVQTALKNAGFNPGNIDGHLGKQTREAIRAFQKANNLTINGKVNKKTWELLGEYLNQKTK